MTTMPKTASSSLGVSATATTGSVVSLPPSSLVPTSEKLSARCSSAGCRPSTAPDGDRAPTQMPGWAGREPVTGWRYLAVMLPGFEPTAQEGEERRIDRATASDADHTWRVGELG